MTPTESFLIDFTACRMRPRGPLSAGCIDVKMAPCSDREVCLAEIKAAVRGRGDGTAAMRKIAELADKHGVEVSLLAVPDFDFDAGGSTARPVDPARLVAFYARFGFVPASGDPDSQEATLVRPPRGASLLDRPEFRLLARLTEDGELDAPCAVAAVRVLVAAYSRSEVAAALEMIAENAERAEEAPARLGPR